MLSSHRGELMTLTRGLRARFAGTAPRRWEPATAAAELLVQAGHLALCMMRGRGADAGPLADPHRPITSLGDELADVLLAVLSITVLAGAEPAWQVSCAWPPARDEVDAVLHLLAAAGTLAEVTLTDGGYRHRPAGNPPSLPQAAGAAVTACEALAGLLGLDMLAEFRAMAADASAFVDRTGQR